MKAGVEWCLPGPPGPPMGGREFGIPGGGGIRCLPPCGGGCCLWPGLGSPCSRKIYVSVSKSLVSRVLSLLPKPPYPVVCAQLNS